MVCLCSSDPLSRFRAHGAREPEDPPVLRILSSLALCLLLATPAAAQLASQTGLVGNVTDAGGGVLPGATVTAVNVGTQATLSGVTNEAGVYQFNAVPLGRYEITITLQGFQTFKATNIEVGGNQVVRQDAVPERRRRCTRRSRWRPPTPRSRPTGPRCRRPSRRAPSSTCRRAAATCGSWRRRRPACCAATPPTSACRSAAPASARSRTA